MGEANAAFAPFDQWCDEELRRRNLPAYLSEHLLTMARLHAANRYDRLTHDVEMIMRNPAAGIRDFVARNKARFENRSRPRPAAWSGDVHRRGRSRPQRARRTRPVMMLR
jgi:hypothetical protein